METRIYPANMSMMKMEEGGGYEAKVSEDDVEMINTKKTPQPNGHIDGGKYKSNINTK